MILRRHAVGAVVATALAACAQGPDFRRPAPPEVTGYLPGQPVVSAQADGGRVCVAEGVPWWSAFGAAPLDALVAEALARNPTLAAAQATLQQSEFSRRAGEGVFFPQLDASLGLSRQHNSPFRFGPAGAVAPIFSLYSLGATISYSLDLSGVQRRTVEALGAAVDAQRYAAAASYLSLSASVVNAAIAHAAYVEQLGIARRVVALQADQLALVQVQFEHGLVAESALRAQTQQLALARAALAPLEQKRAQSAHLLAVLLGRPAAAALPPLPAFAALRLAAAPPLSVPSALVRQRPDILQAEAQLHYVTAELGVATAAEWPSVTLGATGGYMNTAFSHLTGAQGRYWSVGPSVSVPVFRGGAQSNQTRAAAEALHASEASYRQVVLAAFGQVADVLTALEHDAETVQASAQSAEAARRNWRLAEAGADAGLLNRLQRDIAEVAYLQARATEIQGQALQLQDAVALYAAMGGAWWRDGPAWLDVRAPAVSRAAACPPAGPGGAQP